MDENNLIRRFMLEQDEILIMRLALELLKKQKKKKRKHRWWIHNIILNRSQYGSYHHLVRELQLYGEKFQQYFRLNREQFAQILFFVEENLVKHSRTREVICPRQRLTICLRFLATGETFRSIGFNFRVGETTVGKIVAECCEILLKKLATIHMKMPETMEDWKSISTNFERKWNFPHCLGAIDGKHVVMRAPSNSGSIYFNYKGTYSTVLLGLVDADLKFIAIDVGAYGHNSDGGIFSRSNLGKSLARDALNIPADEPIPNASQFGDMPYVIVGDAAFPLQVHLMRPFPGRGGTELKRIYNYRLSRARRVVENAFGVLPARWRVYHTKIGVRPEWANHIVKATCLLHNFLQGQSTKQQVAALIQEAATLESEGLHNLARVGNRGRADAITIRDSFAQYFNRIAPVSWQEAHVNRGIFTE